MVKRAPSMKSGTNKRDNEECEHLFLQETVIYVPPASHSRIRHAVARMRAWRAGVTRGGGRWAEDAEDAGITHVVVGEGGTGGLPESLRRHLNYWVGSQAAFDSDEEHSFSPELGGPAVVDVAWLEQSLLHRCVQKEKNFPPKPVPSSFDEAGTRYCRFVGAKGKPPSMEQQHLKAWAGINSGYNTQSLQPVVYNEERSRQKGNEGVVKALADLARFERSLHQDYFEDAGTGEEMINHRALRYSRAASIVRGCGYPLSPNVRPGQLPFIGPATANQINSILITGTCDELEGFRNDRIVSDSRGVPRYDSVGGRTRALFVALPGVGQRTAKLWWDLGCRSFEDVEAARVTGGPLANDGPNRLSLEQQFSLTHRHDLLQGTNAEEVEELRSTLVQALTYVTFPGWRVEVVGGERRGAAFHDADFLVTHYSRSYEGVVIALRNHLVDTGKLVSPDSAMCKVQHGLLPFHIQKMKSEHLKEASAAPGYQTLDKFDHIYGIAKTSNRRFRRMDIIIVPPEEWGFAELGWIGSRTFLRFLRQHAKDLGMFLNSHALMIKSEQTSYLVPDEHAPRRKDGTVGWPEGWHPGRKVVSESDVFELMGVPYHSPHERNCP